MYYVIVATDKPGSLEARLAARPAHVARLEALREAGRLLTAGPCPALDRVARGADLALIEATFPRARPGEADLHLSVPEARKVGRKARRYGLVHLTAASRALVRPGEALRRYRLEVHGVN